MVGQVGARDVVTARKTVEVGTMDPSGVETPFGVEVHDLINYGTQSGLEVVPAGLHVQRGWGRWLSTWNITSSG